MKPPRLTALMIGVTILLLIATAVLDVGPFVGIGDDLNAILSVFIGFIFTLAHGSVALGWKRIGAFVGITAVVSFIAESAGVATGLVFGSYFYTDNLGPKILGVPPMIQLAYISMSYASMVIARAIFGAFDVQRSTKRILALAFGSALIMVAWDIGMDPYQSTLAADWIWRGGGPYFGVPLHNYVGWFFTVLVFMLIYLFYERSAGPVETHEVAKNRMFRSEPILYYGLVGLGIFLSPLIGGIPDKISSPAENYTGSLQNLGLSLSLIVVFAMGMPVFFALARLFRFDTAFDAVETEA